jgi:hypothetical protein
MGERVVFSLVSAFAFHSTACCHFEVQNLDSPASLLTRGQCYDLIWDSFDPFSAKNIGDFI